MINTGYLETEYGKLKYSITDENAAILEYSGRDLIVNIPEQIEGTTVSVIKKKSFLSQRFVKTISIPKTIEVIEEYAFARCRKLEKIILPYKQISFGQDAFKDCSSLLYISNCYEGDLENDIAFLLAKTLNELNAYFLFDLENAGTDEWFKHLDATISHRLDKDDMEDFSKMILCGEEEVVCGEDGTIEDSNPEHYKSNRVKEKVRIAFLRLMHDYKLNSSLREKLTSYLLDHIKGCATEETWQVVLNEHGDEKEYYDFLLKIEGINNENLSLILSEMGNRHTEIKSYLIKYNTENTNSDDVFSDFEL